jgi:hypothetical protein
MVKYTNMDILFPKEKRNFAEEMEKVLSILDIYYDYFTQDDGGILMIVGSNNSETISGLKLIAESVYNLTPKVDTITIYIDPINVQR